MYTDGRADLNVGGQILMVEKGQAGFRLHKQLSTVLKWMQRLKEVAALLEVKLRSLWELVMTQHLSSPMKPSTTSKMGTIRAKGGTQMDLVKDV
jgi:tRNA-dihydrouridine synthase